MNLELGAQLCIIQDNQKVVDLVGHSLENQPHYSVNHLQNIFSSGKNIEAVSISILVDRNLLSYSDLVSMYWPEFGQYGKENVTISDVLRHQSGLPFFADPGAPEDPMRDTRLRDEDLDDTHKIEKIIETSFTYGNRHYHASTRGWILSGIIRRVDPLKRSLGRFFKEEVSTPLNLDVHCGISLSDQSKFLFADVTEVDAAFLGLTKVLPSMMGCGDEVTQAHIAWFKNNRNVLRRHSKRANDIKICI